MAVTMDPMRDLAIANDSAFGLAGTVWTSDHDRAINVARRVKTGTLGINRLPDAHLGAVGRGEGQRYWPRTGFRMGIGISDHQVHLSGATDPVTSIGPAGRRQRIELQDALHLELRGINAVLTINSRRGQDV